MSSHNSESLEALAAGDKAKSRWAVFEQVSSCRQHGASTDEVAEALGLTPNQVSGRMLELKDDGFIVPLLDANGQQARRLTRSGCFAAVYVARQFARPEKPTQDDLLFPPPERPMHRDDN